ncbi:hypothetical protein [Jeotgalibacillus haloalkalitolerans]|uniref:Sigma-X negative effector n=1 Tax=Jeotgalibacillus haloalkalitolerans TaxID=3104292 RepID=A0ABU5KLA1_9BACL|nr:hypothetical protein [Jeotgalibacillus sp. HH7-29]MDZ5712042.1 hypothetical protein [Jeotgalibacillus sp. HH7-29]
MTKQKWTDQEIEKQLKNMPVIKNRLQPEDIYQHVKLRQRKVKPFPWMPAAAGTAAAALMIILGPGLFNQDTPSEEQSASDTALPFTEESTEDSSVEDLPVEESAEESTESQNTEVFEPAERESEETAETSEAAAEEEQEPANEEEAELQTVTIDDGEGILFREDLGGNQYFEAGLVTNDAYVIPFTIVVPGSDENQSALALYEQWADKIDEASFGFVDYHPVSQSMVEEDNMLTGMINSLEEKTDGASPTILIDVLTETFGSDYSQFRIINENNETAEVGEFGQVESFPLNKDNKGFYLYENEDGSYYYAKSYDQYNSVGEALTAIEEQVPNDQYESPVPENVDVNYELSDTEMTISFEGELSELTREERKQLIESILLTAESFSINAVRFEGLEDGFLEGYNFNEPVSVPIGGNIAYLQ